MFGMLMKLVVLPIFSVMLVVGLYVPQSASIVNSVTQAKLCKIAQRASSIVFLHVHWNVQVVAMVATIASK
jgi:hypothetical protein